MVFYNSSLGVRRPCPASPCRQRGGRLRAAFLLLVSIILSGAIPCCAFLSTGKELSLRTPALPPAWDAQAPRIVYQVEWVAAEGGTRSVTCSPGATVTVEISRLANTALLITPILGTSAGERELLPGAALYPQDLADGSDLRGSWLRGFEGRLFMELQRRGFAYFQVNHERLEAALRVQCGSDPWQADFDRVLKKILEGSFRSSYLRPRPVETGMEELPPGRYLRANLLLEPVETMEIEGRPLLVLEGVYPGHHRLFREGGGELLVSSDGEHRLQWSYFERR